MDPTGGDGYFYLKQLEWLGNHFSFYYKDYSLIFLPLALFYKITGSGLIAFQLTTTFSYFVTTLVLGLLLSQNLLIHINTKKPTLGTDAKTFPKRILQNKYLLLLFSSGFVLLLALQKPFFKLFYQYAKNGFAIALLSLAVYFGVNDKKKLSFLFIVMAL